MDTKTVRRAVVAGILVGMLAGCGNIEATGPGGTVSDVPAGPAVAVLTQGSACTRPTGAGVDATVTPGTGGSPGQGEVVPVPPAGTDNVVPPCYDAAAQVITPSGASLATIAFAIKDGVVQAPSAPGVRIVSQWFSWGQPTAGTCVAVVSAVVEVSVGTAPTCAALLIFGNETDAPIYSYSAN